MVKRFLANSLIFFIGTMLLSVFNYLYNTFMGRFLGPANYSVIGSLLAFISIVTIPTNAVATVAMRFAAHYHAKGQDSTIHSFFDSLTKKLGLIGISVSLLIAVLSPYLANFLHLASALPIIIIAPIIIFAILLPLNRGILQGLQRFMAAIVNQNIDPILKLTFGVLAVKIGWGVNGAVGAIIVASSIAYLLSYLPLKPILKARPNKSYDLPKEINQYSFLALVAFLLATLLMNIDILLVKHFLPAYDAGLYAALSTMGKIILFVTTPIVSVMFPMISDLHGKGDKHYMILGQSFLLVTVIGLGGVVAYYLAPTLIVKILYGSAYAAVAPLMGIFGVTMLLYSLINLWVNYFLSIGNRQFIWFLALSAIVEIGLLIVHHNDFYAVIQSLLVAMITGFATLTGYYLFTKRERLVELLPTELFGTLDS